MSTGRGDCVVAALLAMTIAVCHCERSEAISLRQSTWRPPMPITFLMLPPQGERTRDWARRLGRDVPELEIIAPETMEGAEQAIAGAEGAYGTIPPALLVRADKLRWLQAPQAAPPAGYYYPELIRHPVEISN